MFDPFSPEFFEDPYEVYRRLRDEAPVYHNEDLGFWAVSRYHDCVDVHRDWRAFTSTHGVTLDQLRSRDFQAVTGSIESMIMMDPPMHDRMRKLVSRAFTPRRVAEWEPLVDGVVRSFLDGLDGRGELDAVRDLSAPFPVEVICEIVGVPEGDRQQIRHWTDALLEREVGDPFPTPAGIEASIESGAYMQQLVADKRAHPSDDMIGHLVEAEIERDDGTTDRLTDDEIAGFVTLLTAAGSETVTKLVGNGVMLFAEHPGELEKLRRDPARAPAAVEEVLRHRAPSQYQGRFSTEDRELHGVTIPAGSPVLIITGAANRDPRAYSDPDRFDIDRDGPPSIGFGHGIHYCLGAHLARLESRIALTELYRRWPQLEVDLGAVEWVHMSNVAGPASVPVSV